MDSNCPVCMENDIDNFTFKRFCGYCSCQFHDSCIRRWLFKHNSCPICRCKESFNPEYETIGPKLPSGFVIWAGKTRDSREEYKECQKLKSDIQAEKMQDIDFIILCKKQATVYRKLMTDKYGPRILYKE